MSDRVVRKSFEFCFYSSREERNTDMESVNERLKDSVKEMAGKMMLIWQKEKSMFESNRNFAEAAISNLLDKAGYDYYIRYNHGHAKVHIKITRYKKAILYLKYDRLGRQIPKVLETLESMKRIYEIFGSGSGVVSLYNCDNDIFDEIRAEKEEREKGEEHDEGYDCFSY